MIIAYHAAKTEEVYEAICRSRTLIPGVNVSTKEEWVHLSLTPFRGGGYALDVIGPDTNEAWVFELVIPDDTELLPDPSGDGEIYGGKWVVHRGDLKIKITSVLHITHVQKWEETGGNPRYMRKLL